MFFMEYNHVEDYYTVSELFNYNFSLMLFAFVLIKTDSERPNIIKTRIENHRSDLLHKYTKVICDMPYTDFKELKQFAQDKLKRYEELKIKKIDDDIINEMS